MFNPIVYTQLFKKFIYWLSISIFGVIALSNINHAHANPILNQPPAILVLGDSHIVAYQNTFAQVIQEKTRIPTFVMAKNGRQFINYIGQHNNLNSIQQLKPNYLVVAFGTNESVSASAQDYERNKRQWTNLIKTIQMQISQNRLPNHNIIIVGAPLNLARQRINGNTCRNGSGMQSIRANEIHSIRASQSLYSIQSMQYQIAKENGYQYWSWHGFMLDFAGGNSQCIIDKFINHNPPLMQADLVHFTKMGYRLAALDMMKYVDIK